MKTIWKQILYIFITRVICWNRIFVSSSTTTTTKMSTITEMDTSSKFEYDYIVIGGGSGGMASAKEAAKLGAKVVLFDFVKPSTQGTKWGLGGTCVNVGCVPKKLMHYSGLVGHSLSDAEELGFRIKSESHDWSKLVTTVTNHVKMLNFRYRVGLKSNQVDYINALASFVDEHTVQYSVKTANGMEFKTVTARNILIAVGGRPHIPSDVPGALEYAITSDDIFFKKTSPGKTLCVGGAYIALECAGFLTELGYDVTVAARSILLRGFDRECAEKIGTLMSEVGTKILQNTIPKSISKLPNGQLQVVLQNSATGLATTDVYDTVLFATGRNPDLAGLNLVAAGVRIESSGKIPVTDEQTNVPSVFAVGDVCAGKQELTPVAIKAGELLARRLFSDSSAKMDYDLVPTTVFTPYEYGCVGLTEEEALQRYGEHDVEVYLQEFTTLEHAAVHRRKFQGTADEDDMSASCLSKLVCLKSAGERVVGFHFVGPNAGEVTQGFALALRLGATKADFDNLVGIHPTDAESFCILSVTRRSGEPYSGSGCGGGKCG